MADRWVRGVARELAACVRGVARGLAALWAAAGGVASRVRWRPACEYVMGCACAGVAAVQRPACGCDDLRACGCGGPVASDSASPVASRAAGLIASCAAGSMASRVASPVASRAACQLASCAVCSEACVASLASRRSGMYRAVLNVWNRQFLYAGAVVGSSAVRLVIAITERNDESAARRKAGDRCLRTNCRAGCPLVVVALLNRAVWNGGLCCLCLVCLDALCMHGTLCLPGPRRRVLRHSLRSCLLAS